MESFKLEDNHEVYSNENKKANELVFRLTGLRQFKL